MKRDDLIVGEDYITYRGEDADAFGAQRLRLLSKRTVGRSKSGRVHQPPLTMEVEDGREIEVRRAVASGETHLVFEEVNPKTGQPRGTFEIFTPSQIKAGWAEGIAIVEAAKRERQGVNSAQEAERERSKTIAESATGRIANLLPKADPAVSVSRLNGARVTLSAQTLSDLLDLAQRAKFGPV